MIKSSTFITTPQKKNTIDDFCQEFPYNNSLPEKEKSGYFFKGMNGGHELKISGQTVQEYINSLYGNYYTSINQPNDHSKMVILYDSVERNHITDKEIDGLLIKGDPLALMIGSSNQSKESYIVPAKKGEADVFLVHSRAFKNNNNADQQAIAFYDNLKKVLDSEAYDIIFTKEIKGSNSLDQIVKKILMLK